MSDTYRDETIARIRELSPKLRYKTSGAISELYREWSFNTYSASWLIWDDSSLFRFIAWATTAPCDRYKDQSYLVGQYVQIVVDTIHIFYGFVREIDEDKIVIDTDSFDSKGNAILNQSNRMMFPNDSSVELTELELNESTPGS